jgi:hypothetical protein
MVMPNQRQVNHRLKTNMLQSVTEKESKLFLKKKKKLTVDRKRVKLFWWHQHCSAGSFSNAWKTSA